MPRVRRWMAAAAVAAAVLAGRAAAQPAAVYYQICLLDGARLSSYGEFARVADRVVFSMRVGGSDEAPLLKLVSLPADKVNWAATEKYADAARAAHYAATRGEAEYAALSEYIAGTLNDIALTSSPALQLQMAETARRYLAAWSRSSFGYRARDVAQLSTLLDEAAAEIQARMGSSGNGGGARGFDVQLVAMMGPPPEVPLAPPPDLRQSIEQALAAAAAMDDPTERKALLQSASRALAGVEEAWAAPLARKALAALKTEARIDAAYTKLSDRAVRRAEERAAAADVRGLQAIIAEVLTQDDRLGRRRPAEVSALLATLDLRLDAARRLRLALDRYELHLSSYRRYAAAVERVMALVRRLRAPLEDIRALAGPDRAALLRARSRADEAALALDRIDAPDDLMPVHALFKSGLQLAGGACAQRLDAIRRGDVKTAWAASSAAAGALMLLERAQEDLTRWLKPPSLP